MILENAGNLRSALHGFNTTLDASTALRKDILSCTGKELLFATREQYKQMNAGGAAILLNCHRMASQDIDDESWEEWINEWESEVILLQRGIDEEEEYMKEMKKHEQRYHDQHQKAFDLEYIEVSGSIDSYCSILHKNMERYLENIDDYMAPYTAIVTSSMMGKSRLMKQIALSIPAVYVSLRPKNDGYPDRSPESVICYILQTPLTSRLEGINLFLTFYIALYNHLETFFDYREGTPAQVRTDLWMILGQGEENRPKHVHCIKPENINEEDPIYKSITEVPAF